MPEQPPSHPIALSVAVVVAWLAIAFVAIRIAIPALTNMQNDGALILAVVLGVATAFSPMFVWLAIGAILKEHTDED